MMKKIFIGTFIAGVTTLFLLWLMLASIQIEWGHHFDFENELAIDIDSLEITVGDVPTMIQAAMDSTRSLEGNINVPEKGYPHRVIITVFSQGEKLVLPADSFNCYNCDGNHEYILRDDGADYQFHP